MRKNVVQMKQIVEKMSLKNLTPDVELSDKAVEVPDINRPALQLTGFFESFDSERVQVIGYVEYSYLTTLKEKEKEKKEEENSTEDIKQENTNNKIKTYITSNGQKYDSIGIINIPSLGIEYPILATTSEKTLKVSVTKYWGGNPNEVGNLCITGHNYKNSKFFGKLLSIKQGDIINITDLSGRTLDYTVYDTYVVDPKDTTCTSQLTDGKVEVTLITCYYENGNAHATKRFIVKARVK